ncbi:uncharacterized protein JCM15063_004489 [Sporobolomyces koalae]|uniref:uncharacterized protein n=1 Tax=Sporobolomyces koalae TaxID=500713 RepID=UPI00317617D4
MRTSTTALALSALVSYVKAGGIIDNTAEAASILASASGLSGEGNYVITNVQTGQQLSFAREDGTTNFYPQSGGDPVAIQFAGNAARISGGNNKCASAQWSYDFEGGVDYAAVSYACAVGEGLLTGTDTLEKTKQWWYFVPAGTTSDDSSSSDKGALTADKLNALKGAKAAKVASQQVTSSAEAAAPAPSSEAPAPKAESTPAASSPVSAPASGSSSSSSSGELSLDQQKAKYGYYTTSASSISIKDVDVSKVNKQDKSTWICRHPGWWLARHSAYVKKHVECASDLKAYLKDHPESARRLAKRASHHDMAKKLQKKGQQTFYIIAVDHILDMSTRAIAGSSLSTFGGYTSTTLSLWNKGDNSQLWTVSSA